MSAAGVETGGAVVVQPRPRSVPAPRCCFRQCFLGGGGSIHRISAVTAFAPDGPACRGSFRRHPPIEHLFGRRGQGPTPRYRPAHRTLNVKNPGPAARAPTRTARPRAFRGPSPGGPHGVRAPSVLGVTAPEAVPVGLSPTSLPSFHSVTRRRWPEAHGIGVPCASLAQRPRKGGPAMTPMCRESNPVPPNPVTGVPTHFPHSQVGWCWS